MRNRLRAALIGVGSLVDLHGRATRRRLTDLTEPSVSYFCAYCAADEGEEHDELCYRQGPMVHRAPGSDGAR